MIDFGLVEAAATERLGGIHDLEQRLVRAEPPESLAMIGDDRYLSVMSRRIFRAGLTHRLVDARWPAFEAAFNGFEPARVATLSDDDLIHLSRDARLIRHRRKLFAVRTNATAMQAIAEEHGGFGVWLADWPTCEIVDLWNALQTNFQQLGGRSSSAFLRMCGKDTFLLTDWVVRALAAWGLYAGATRGDAALRAVQAVFNQLHAACQRDYCQISQILALSID